MGLAGIVPAGSARYGLLGQIEGGQRIAQALGLLADILRVLPERDELLGALAERIAAVAIGG
jgi:hypothetical protein